MAMANPPVLPDARPHKATVKRTHLFGDTMSTRCVIGGVDCFRLRAVAGGLTPEKRMGLVNDRLASVLPGYGRARCRSIRRGDSNVLVLNGKTLVCITPADVKANGSSMAQLVRIWSSNVLKGMRQ